MSDFDNLPLFPLHTVLFLGMELPLRIFGDRCRALISQCLVQTQEGQWEGGHSGLLSRN